MAQKGFVNINKWYGGMSEVDTLMAEGQYVYSENIDIRRDPDYIELNHKPQLRFNTNELVVSAVNAGSGPFYFGGNNPLQDNIYDETGSVVYTMTQNNFNIVDSIVVGDKLLFMYLTGASVLQVGCIDVDTAPQGASWLTDSSFTEFCNINAIVNVEDSARYLLGRQVAGPPVGTGLFIGEVWLDTAGNTISSWDGTVWNLLGNNLGDRHVDVLNGNIIREFDGAAWLTLTALGITAPPNLVGQCIPMYELAGILYLGVGRYIKRLTFIDGFGFLVEDAIEMSDRVIGIDEVGNLLKIFMENGKVCYWDGFSSGVQSCQSISSTFRYQKSFGAYSYIVGGFSNTGSELYLNQGLQFQGLKFASLSEGAENKAKFLYDIENRCGQNNMTQYQNIIYTAGVNNQFPQEFHISSWGNKWNGFPMAFNIETTLNSQNNTMDSIGMVFHETTSNTGLTYSWEDGGTYGIDLVPLSVGAYSTKLFVGSGLLYSQKFVLDHTETKRLYAMDIRYANTDIGKEIQIEYALDGGAYQPLVTIDQSTDTYRKESKYRKIISLNELPNDDRFEIQFKLTFVTDDENISPRLYHFKPLYEINEQ